MKIGSINEDKAVQDHAKRADQELIDQYTYGNSSAKGADDRSPLANFRRMYPNSGAAMTPSLKPPIVPLLQNSSC